MLSSASGQIKNGRPSIYLPLRFTDWHLIMNEALARAKAGQQNPALREPYGRLINPVHGLAAWPISADGHSKALQVEALFKIGLNRGEVGRHGRLTPPNSCAAMPSAILALALSSPEFTHADDHIPLDQLSIKLMDKAPKRYWAKEGLQAYIYDIVAQRRGEVFVEIDRDAALDRVGKIVAHPQMFKKQPVPGFASYGNQYLNFEQEHPNPKARAIYREEVCTLVEDLRRRAQ